MTLLCLNFYATFGLINCQWNYGGGVCNFRVGGRRKRIDVVSWHVIWLVKRMGLMEEGFELFLVALKIYMDWWYNSRNIYELINSITNDNIKSFSIVEDLFVFILI